MLFAVEGGGFFSSSASGYSKGLTLLLLGHKNVDKPMRVLPWNQHYQLVDQVRTADPHLQLASGKNRLVRGCTSFLCFGCTAAGLETPSPLKFGPTTQHQVGAPVSDTQITTDIVDEDNNTKKVALKSSLKKKDCTIQVPGPVVNEGESVGERRKVQWQDVSGGELVDVREYEPRYIIIYGVY